MQSLSQTKEFEVGVRQTHCEHSYTLKPTNQVIRRHFNGLRALKQVLRTDHTYIHPDHHPGKSVAWGNNL